MENQPQAPVTENDSDVTVVDPLDSDAVKKALETMTAQKKHFREKARKEAEDKAALQKQFDELKQKYEKPEPPTPKLETEKPLDFDTIADSLNVLRELSKDEFEELRSEAKTLGIDPAKYVKSKAGQAHLNEYRTVQKSKSASPAPSARIPVFNGKPVTQIFTDPKASPQEKQAAFEERMRKVGVNSSQ